MVFQWLGWSRMSELCFVQCCSLVRMFRMVWWSGKLGWLVQFIWLISLIVSVVLVKWLECWHQVVRMIYQILDRIEIVL